MSVYIVTGKLGSGKSLASVGRIRDYLRAGRRVATNLDLYLDDLLGTKSRATVTRLPDKPRVVDLNNIGKGNETRDEKKNGLLVLDECGSWLNSRAWQDKERAGFIEWVLHARKLGWDVILLVQHVEMIDVQVRNAICEHLVICRRLDRFRVPLVGRFLGMLGIKVKPPRIHVGTVYYGDVIDPFWRVDRWWYRGNEFFSAYDTLQVFSLDLLYRENQEPVDMRCSYTMLSPWHTVGRYQTSPNHWENIKLCIFSIIYLIVVAVGAARGRSPRAALLSTGLFVDRQPKQSI